SKGYTYGLQKIYEMVINNDPTYAYLLHSNSLVAQKMVMAHVFGHADFFKNNDWFAHTNRKMIDEMANHGSRVRKYIERYGLDEVEAFLDICLSLDNLIDYHAPFIKRHADPEELEKDADDVPVVARLEAKDYMRHYINPPQYIEEQERKLREEQKKKKEKFPIEPEKDVLLFLLHHAPLEAWQHDILGIVREEAYYFAPQGQTKIMNEGWASYWHSKIMTEKVLDDSEVIDYADMNAGLLATAPGQLNPYKLGVELFRDIEDRWNKGKFGKEYEACDDMVAKKNWNKELGLGREKIFQVRKLYNDITFIDTFLTPEFCVEQKLFTYAYDRNRGVYYIEDREFRKIKEKLLNGLTNFGQPRIYVEDANYGNRGELYLTHRFDGIELQIDYARDTLVNLFKIWKRPVNLQTVVNNKGVLLSFNGEKHIERTIQIKE
ncbi:MAG: SpoVR family protein, partial [Deltaproteobacteria bacterium]